MSKGKQKRWTEAFAREVLERAERQGQSDGALARELGVSAQRVSWWRRRLGVARGSSTPGFVEVRVRRPEQRQPFVVSVRGGRTVEVWPGFDQDELRRLLAVMEGDAPC